MAKHKELLRTIKFALFSVSAGIIEMVLFTLLTAVTGWDYWPRYLIALVASVLWDFTLNRQFTFQSAGNVPAAMIKVAIYYMIFTPLTTVGGNYLAEGLGWNDFVVTALNMCLNFVTEYLYDRFIVFGRTIDTNKRAKNAESTDS